MKILFIGGTGTLSKDTVVLAEKNNNEIYLFNRGNNNNFNSEKIKYIKGDIYNIKDTKNLIKDYDFDVVIDYLVFSLDVLKDRINLFQNKTKQYIYISTATVFPPSENTITEESKKGNDGWIYSKRKLECEKYLENNKDNLGFFYTIVRPYLTYDNRRIPFPLISKVSCWNLLYRIQNDLPIIMCGNGQQKITITNTKDFAYALYSLLLNEKSYNDDFNLVGNTVVTWNDIINNIEDCLGKKAKVIYVDSEKVVRKISSQREEILFDKSQDHVFDNSKIKNIVPNFSVNNNIHEDIKSTISNLLENNSLHIFDGRWNIAENILSNKYGKYDKCVVSKKDIFINWFYDSSCMYNIRKIWHSCFKWS